ncbi:hypothetical protein CFP71_36165 [Amycolatopsis thailandensis]|uniref:DUF3558 domain-containing protein n=1 Tax=Amycolatopsis thailandensis TaxID=589330 RepID=A0A229RK08_9PSEU|nr:hypothetical protein [Amycolatopsis thailandensis]OXM46992.1 hypothetical protein CFP71_36165 [Amycolatopsis thailandensis]
MGRSTAFAVLTAAVLVLAGCAVTPPAPTPPPSSPLTLREALGDPTTVDFCGLLDLPDLDSALPLESRPSPSMGSCSFRTKNALISFGFPEDRAKERLTGATPVAWQDLTRDLRVVRTDLEGQPLLHLVFTDDSSIRVGTFFTSPGSASEALAAATKTLEGAVRSLVAGKQAAHFDYRENSLARLEACSALWSDSDVSARLGTTVSGKGDLSRHRCLWGEQGADRLARLEFGLGPRPKAAANVQEETLGGRKSFVQEISGGCTVRTSHVEGPGANRNQVEHALLAVQAPNACDVARELANVAWPKLPA